MQSMNMGRLYLIFYFNLLMGWQCVPQKIMLSNFVYEDEKLDLRKTLDEVTQSQIDKVSENHLYHSYIFNSGVGNREELQMDSIERVIEFAAGTGVMSWQSAQCAGQVFLLGRSLASVSLLVTSTQLLSNRSAQFSEHVLDLGSRVAGTSLMTIWNTVLAREEVIGVVAVDSLKADILWYRVVANKLVNITCWSRYKRTTSMAAIKGEGKNQLVVIDASSPATVDVFDIIFTTDENNLDLRLAQSFSLASECSSITVCRIARQIYLVFTQPSHQSVAVYRQITVANTSFFENYTTLPFPRVSQVVSFSLASQVYLAVSGDNAYVFRLTDTGHFVEELSVGSVSKWLAVPVSSYRRDVVLFSQNANNTNAFIWGGTNKGFIPAPMPKCDWCLQGDWSGAVTIQLRHRNCLLLPQANNASSLVTIATSLHNRKNPIEEQIDSMIKSMEQHEDHLKHIQLKLTQAEESLKHIIKVNGENVVTAKWKLGKISTPQLLLNSMTKPRPVVNSSSDPDSAEVIDVSTLNALVDETLRAADQLQKDVLQKEKEVWGLERFAGKVTVKGRLIVSNLTITNLNGNSMDDILQNSFRRDNPQVIRGSKVIHSLQADNIFVGQWNDNLTEESIKFHDKPVVVKGNVTFLGPLNVEGGLNLEAGARVNGLNLSKELCQGEEHCAVLPNFEIESRGKEFDNIKKYNFSDINKQNWKHVIGGKNISVKKLNGIDWELLTKNIVFTDHYEQIPGTTIVNGALSSDTPVWVETVETVEEDYSPQQRVADNPSKISLPPSKKSPVSADRKVEEETLINPYSNLIFTELEVTGTVTCDESEWGASASDVILSDVNPIHIYGHKIFKSNVTVANNLGVKGLVGGVNISELLTTDTPQIFTDSTTLNGNITLGNITVSGSWNGINISNSTSNSGRFSIDAEFMREVNADRVKVTETLNGLPVTELLFTDSNGITSVKELIAQNLSVTSNISVAGKVSNQDLTEYKKRRLSIKEEQTVSGNFVIGNATVANDFAVETLNNLEMSTLTHDLGNFSAINEIHLSALHVDGNITTELGVNGYNLSEVAASAVWLLSNNIMTGHLNFTDVLTIDWLECQGFFNQKVCQKMFDVTDVVFKANGTNIFSGKKRFLHSLNIVDDLYVKEINGHKVETIMTKTTDQVIDGDVFVFGNVTVADEFTLEGLLNNQNLTQIGSRCKLSGDTIRCKGDAEFEGSVDVENFNCLGKVNGINFNNFSELLVDVQNPQPIEGFKNFSGLTTVINLVVYELNNNSWDDFLVNTVTQNSNEAVESAVFFEEKVTAFNLSLDYDLDADSINGVDLNKWRENAIYLNDSFYLNRTLHLSTASSAGNLTIVTYGNVNMGVDLIRLHSPTIMDHLSVEAVTVLEPSDMGFTVNGKDFEKLEQQTLKVSGDQIVTSDFLLSGDISVSGNVTVEGLVNRHNLLDVVTLDFDQNLHGNYKFECVEAIQNVTSAGLMSTVNMSKWKESAVVKQERQEVTGVWTVLGDMELRGPVRGKGRLADVNLAQLKDNITRDILHVHQALKSNLTSACEETNHYINQARNQTSEFLFLDLSQEISVPDEVSLVTHFKSEGGDFLAISDKNCTTTVYKWDQINGSYSRLFSELLGYGVRQLVALHHNQRTYLVSVSADLSMNCYFSGKHLWLFTQDNIKHVSLVDLGATYEIQAYKNRLYSMNATGVFKWDVQLVDGGVNFAMVQMWTESTAGKRFMPEDSGLGLALHNTIQITSLEADAFILGPHLFNNCSGEIVSVSVNPIRQLVAAATSEKTQVPRYSDYVKVYHLNGSLFDKIPAQNASDVHWFHVPGQTWLVFTQNHSSINLYHLQGVFEGFQLRLSAKIEGIANLSSLALPLASKVNLQPFLIVQTTSSVKVLQVIFQGDPYLRPDVSCNFDDTLHPVPTL